MPVLTETGELEKAETFDAIDAKVNGDAIATTAVIADGVDTIVTEIAAADDVDTTAARTVTEGIVSDADAITSQILLQVC